jgi:MFS transporter, ACS family, glucarate transporter
MIDPKTSPLTARPTRVRYAVLALLCALAMITYLDRAVYGSAKQQMMEAVHQPENKFYYLLVAFQLAYALFEVPTGWMGDTFGPRATLLRIVLWWSLFIGLTALAGMPLPGSETVLIGFGVLVALQFFFGMGEAGAFPNITRALYNWFPATQRGFAQGSIWLSARFMGGMTPVIWVLLTVFAGFDWRQALWLFAGLAALWCLVFYLWFRNRPQEHPATNEAERALIDAGRPAPVGHAGVPWGTLLRSRNLRFICLMYTVTNFNWYFLMYYLPGALKEQFADLGKSDWGKVQLALLGGAPLLIGMLGCMLGGLLTDRYVRRTGDRKWGRRVYGMLGYALAGVCYLAATFVTHNFWLFAGCLMMVGFFNDLIMSSAWATCQDVGRRYAAIVSGCMNMIGNLGAAVGNYVTGTILENYAQSADAVGFAGGGLAYATHGTGVRMAGYTTCFTLYAIIYVIGVFLWLKIDASKPIVPDEPTSH